MYYCSVFKITKSFHHSQRKIDTGDKNSYENYNSKTTFQQCIVIQRLTSKHSSFFKPISYRLYQKVKRVNRLSINVHMSTLHVQSNILCIQSFKNFFQTLPLILCTYIRFFNCNRLSMTVYIPVMHCLQCVTLLVYFQLQDVCDVVSKGLDSTTLTFTKTTSCVSKTILGALAMILVRVKITQNSLRL